MIKRILFGCLLIAGLVPVNAQKTATKTTVPGSRPIPKWKIEDVVNSFSAKNDTVYVVNFWATFCKPCNEEIPDFIRIVDKYKTQKVKLLLVSLDLPSYVAVRLPAFIKKYKYNTNHVWLNETDADKFCPMIDSKWSGAIPATIIVNNNTGYKKFVEDQIKPAEFEAALKEAMGTGTGVKLVAPMNEAEAVPNIPGEYITFSSKDSSVFSVAGGKVNMIAKIDHMKVVIIEKDKILYTYSNLGSTLLKTGDLVKPDQLIGYAAYDMDGIKPSLELYISDNAPRVFSKRKAP